MPINKNELTKEMVEKALNVKDAKELMALAWRSWKTTSLMRIR